MFGKLARRKLVDFTGAGDGAVASFIEILLCKSAFKAALNSGRGKARRARTSGTSLPTLAFESPAGTGGEPASNAVMALSSCSAGERLGMAVSDLRAQCLKRAELQLLNGALRFAEALRDFADAAVLHKALADHAALHFRKLLHHPKEVNVALNELEITRRQLAVRQGMLKIVKLLFAICALVLIDDGVGGDAIK